ncbi:GDP-mannose 4,6-dehydratase [Caenimonas koreensis]|uniref:GDP-mannose 4,6-dehydratase n=1 Tax=Caenimonas koreensis TaxID=367474 RepID=UPI0022643B06|nr:GDP-mannose 4,6-dehydratase [Caenimonas koreensis]
MVTGLTGFVGSWCVGRFGQTCDLVDDQGWIDMRDASRVTGALHAIRPDAVVHLAAQSSVAASLQNPQETHEINFGGTRNLLNALASSGFRGRMLYVGSADVYGHTRPGDLPVTEQCAVQPLNPYSLSKLQAESLCIETCRDAAFEIVIARPFNHIGPRQGVQFAISDFARQIVACRDGRRPARLAVGNVDITRDFTDVRDIVHSYELLLEAGHNGEVYNVCSGVERSMREVIGILCAVSGVEVALDIDERRLRPAEQQRMCGSYARLASVTGWAPSIPFEQTLRDIVDYWHAKDSS